MKYYYKVFCVLQVFQYDGTLSCTGIEFGLFVLVGLALVVFFVAPAPLAVGYICRKRPLVSYSFLSCLTVLFALIFSFHAYIALSALR